MEFARLDNTRRVSGAPGFLSGGGEARKKRHGQKQIPGVVIGRQK